MITGKEIYENIRVLKEDVDELAKACDTVSDELGQGSLAYKHLDEAYKSANERLTNAMHRDYQVPIKIR